MADGANRGHRSRPTTHALGAIGALACLGVVVAMAGRVVAQSGAGGGIQPQQYRSLEYRYIGPPGNRIEVVAGVAGDPSVIYAGSPSGGVFKTTDGRLHWQPIFEEIASTGAIAIAPFNPDVVWIGTGETFIRSNISVGQGIYKSTDAGRTFTRAGLDATGRIARIIVDPGNSDIVHVAALGHSYGPQPDRGVFRTRDGGKSWQRVLFVDENTEAVDLVIDPSNPRTLFAATWQFAIYPWWSESGGPGSGIHVSRDGGTTWTRVVGRGLGPDTQDVYCSLFAIAESSVERGVIWAGSTDGLVHVTRDGGKGWSNVTPPASLLSSSGTISSIEPSPHAAGTAYITVDRHRANDSRPYIFRTRDYGHTWTAIANGITNSPFSYVRVVREDPKRPGLLYAGTENGLWISFDDGTSWLALQNNLPPTPVSWMVVQPDFDDLVISTFGRGFWILDDLTPLRQLTTAVVDSPHFLFTPRPGYLLRPGAALVASNLAADFDAPSDAGRNPPRGTPINYYLKAGAAGEVRLQVLDGAGAVVRTLMGPRTPGINRVWWDLYAEAPAGGSRGLPFGAMNRPTPLVPAGTYTIKLLADGREYSTKLTLKDDPNSDWR